MELVQVEKANIQAYVDEVLRENPALIKEALAGFFRENPTFLPDILKEMKAEKEILADFKEYDDVFKALA